MPTTEMKDEFSTRDILAGKAPGDAPVTVKSGMLEMLAWVTDWPQPST